MSDWQRMQAQQPTPAPVADVATVQIPVRGAAAIRAAERFGTALYVNGYVTPPDAARSMTNGRRGAKVADQIYTRLSYKQFEEWSKNA